MRGSFKSTKEDSSLPAAICASSHETVDIKTMEKHVIYRTECEQ